MVPAGSQVGAHFVSSRPDGGDGWLVHDPTGHVQGVDVLFGNDVAGKFPGVITSYSIHYTKLYEFRHSERDIKDMSVDRFEQRRKYQPRLKKIEHYYIDAIVVD